MRLFSLTTHSIRVFLSFLGILLSFARATASPVTAFYSSVSDIPISAASYAATGNTIEFQLNFAPPTGTCLTVVENTGLTFIDGAFANLAQGQIVELPFGGIRYRFVADYFGGSGNDLVLQWAETRPFGWGANFSGGLGTGDTKDADIPMPVQMTGALAGKTLLKLANGFGFSLALCSDGSLAGWGENSGGQLGNGDFTDSLLPVAVDMTGILAGKRVIALSAGYDFCLALCSDGTMASWGSNNAGKLGIGAYSPNLCGVPTEVQLQGPLLGKKFVAISAGFYHSMALCSDGTVASWGGYPSGQADNINLPMPVNPSGALLGKTVVSISAGAFASYAVCSDGTAASWGSGVWGILGTGSSDGSEVPVGIPAAGALAGKNIATISAGYRHVLALCTDGSLVGWGENSDGQLGVENPTSSSLPIPIPKSGALSGKSITSISAKYEFSLALCSDGTMACWGSGGSVALGNGDFRGSKLPVSVVTTQLGQDEQLMTISSSPYGNHSLSLVATPYLPRLFLEEPLGIPLKNHAGILLMGNAPAGSTLSRTLIIHNRGLATLAIEEVFLEGLHAGDFSISKKPAAFISAGGSTEITISFTAGSTFGGSAELRITSNDPHEGDFHCHLAATVQGTLRAIYLAPTDVPAQAMGFELAGSDLQLSLEHPPVTGENLTVLENLGLGFISGTFRNLIQGQPVSLTYGGISYDYVANYYGGSGNDLVLQWSPNRLMAWGANASGQLGIGNTTLSLIPVPVASTGILAGKTIVTANSRADFSLALCADGTLAGWGSGGSGRLGNGTTASPNVPMAAGVGGALAGKTVVAIAVGGSHNLALCSDGTLAAWGSNSNGNLGDGSTTNRTLPVAVDRTGVLAHKHVVAIAAGANHSLALCSDGSVAAWGANGRGKLGDATRLDRPLPVLVSFGDALAGKVVTSIAAGQDHSLALCSDGTLVSWGNNRWGQLGIGTASDENYLPVAVSISGPLAGKTIVAIAAGSDMSAALCSDHTLVTWGRNPAGELGDGSLIDSAVPVAVNTSGGLADKIPIDFSSGWNHMIALCSDGSLLSWGSNNSGQLGNGGRVHSTIPALMNSANLLPGEKFTTGIRIQGSSHSLGIVAIPRTPRMIVEQPEGDSLPNGSTVAFVSKPPDGTTTRTFSLRNTGLVPLEIGDVAITGSHASEFVLTEAPSTHLAPGNATVFSITFTTGSGFSREAQLRISSNDPYTEDFRLNLTAQGSGLLQVEYSGASNIPLAADQLLATGNQIAFSLNFAPIVGTTLTVVDMRKNEWIQGRFDNLNQGQEIVLTYNGKPYRFIANYYGGTGNDLVLQWAGVRALSWGLNNGGQLGRGDRTSRNVPASVSTAGALNGKVILKLATGANHSLALCSDGTIAAWGSNQSGQLGDGTTTSRSTPVSVDRSGLLAGRTAIAIAAGASHSLALCSDGTIYAWGSGSSGQLGNGSISATTVPVAVDASGALFGKMVVAVAAGGRHNVALCSDGTMIAWGENLYGQLGNSWGPNSAVPVAIATTGVLSGKFVTQVATGGAHTLALCSDGTIAAWGDDTFGQLGNANTFTSELPSKVESTGALFGKTIAALSAGQYHSMALCTDGTLIGWGSSAEGELGVEFSSWHRPMEMRAVAGFPGSPLKIISAGFHSSLAVLSDGSVATWGFNANGQLGNGSSHPRDSPGLVALGGRLPDEKFVSACFGPSIFAGHVLALVAHPAGPRMTTETEDNQTILAEGEFVEVGKALPGAAISRTFVVRNSGDAPLTGLAVSLSGAEASEFTLSSPTTTNLAPGAICRFTITFSPSVQATRIASLKLTADSTPPGSQEILLSGVGLTNSQAWRWRYFQTIGNSGSAADSATPQNDGISNLMKFATGMDPTQPGLNPGSLSTSESQLTFIYRRAKAAVADGLAFTVEWSDTLDASSWNSVGVIEVAENQGDIERVTATLPTGLGPRRFVRLRVTYP